MDISDYSSNHYTSSNLPLNKRYAPTGKENVYFLSELNSPVTARRYNDDNSESDSFFSDQIVDQSRIVFGDITEMFVDTETISLSDRLSANDRSETNSSRRDSLYNSKVDKKPIQNKNMLNQNLKSYSSVPSKPSAQSKALRAWLSKINANKNRKIFYYLIFCCVLFLKN
mgnify:CR=1 FL=1